LIISTEKIPKPVAFEMWFRPVVKNARQPNFSPLRGDKLNVSKEYLTRKQREAAMRKKVGKGLRLFYCTLY
jgi:hypothetical protein